MKTQLYPIDYAVYIDDRQSIIIAVNHSRQPDYTVVDRLEREPEEEQPRAFFQNAMSEHIRQLCMGVIDRLGNAHRLLIFGPTAAKYALRDTLKSAAHLIFEEREHLVTTDSMTEAEALRFSQCHLTYESNVTRLS